MNPALHSLFADSLRYTLLHIALLRIALLYDPVHFYKVIDPHAVKLALLEFKMLVPDLLVKQFAEFSL